MNNRNSIITDYASEKCSRIAIYTIILSIFVVVGRVQEIIPGLAALSLGKISFGLLCISYFIVPNKSRQVSNHYQLKNMFYIFGLGMLSIITSFWPSNSFKFMIFIFMPSIVMSLLVFKVVMSYKDLVKIIWSIVVSLTVINIAALSLSFESRISASSTYDPNDLALIIVLFLPIFYYLSKLETGWKKILLINIIIVSSITLMATQSRGGFLGFITVVLCIIVRERLNDIKKWVVLVGVLFTFTVLTPDRYIERLATILEPEQDYNVSSKGGRLDIWKNGLYIMFKHPLLGVGPAAFEVAEGATHINQFTGETGKWSTAHNSFIQIGGELGLPGIILFLLMIKNSIRSLRRIRVQTSDSAKERFLVEGVEISFYGYIVSGFFLSQAYVSALFLLVAFSAILTELDTVIEHK